MPDVRFICLSDTHLGADTSILSRLDSDGEVDSTRPSDALVQLAACVRTLVAGNAGPEKPTLILNGDVLEFALATTNVAITCFQRALELLFPAGEAPTFSRMIYLPGNHDHHIWQAAREQEYCAEVLHGAPGNAVPHIPYATPLLGSAPLHSALLDALMRRMGSISSVPVDVAYPNLALRSEDGQRSVVFHHGHFLEPIYSMMSRLQTALFPGRSAPATVAELEADNGAWIDFFWSSLGSSGDVGPDVELLYEKLQDPNQVKVLLSNLAAALARNNEHPSLVAGLKAFALTHLIAPIAAPLLNFFRSQTAESLSEQERQGLTEYLTGPLRQQLVSELDGIPPSFAFAFGHTHRPFERELRVEGLPNPVQVFNTGGWVVDSRKTEPLNGASMLLVDEHLEVVSVRLYTESDHLDTYRVAVTGLPGGEGQMGPFQRRIAALVQRSPESWRAFSRAAGRAVAERRGFLNRNIRRAA